MAFGHLAGKRPPGRKSRTREGLHLRPLNVEKGDKRFSLADDSFPPQTATWRNNLIALSQRRNLLFVAYSHQIYVWEPAGSFQMLGSVPLMIITPVMKESSARGFISPNTPHAINNILVDDLGREEVLLLVTDSGNVCGYRTEAIFSALKRAADDEESRPLDGSQVDPFFVEYVEASAWGLAIHKFARLIAVSANTGLITVFAFALVNPASGGSSDSSQRLEEEDDLSDYGQTWLHITTPEQFVQLRHMMPEKHRTRNIKLTYTGHFANIPSVSFLNCDLDPNGNWMVSTDIDNKLLVWKIWDGLGAFNMYHFNDIGFRSFHDTLRNDERGWSVIALDPRSFHLLKSTEEACGGRPQRRVKDGQPVFDLTKLSGRVPNASQLYNYFPPAVKAEPERPVLPDIFGVDCRISKGGDTRQGMDRVASSESSDTRETNHFHAIAGYLRPSDSADAFSHRAVDGSVYDDNMSHGSSSELNLDVDSQQTSGLETAQQISDPDQHTSNGPPRTRRPPQTTPEFLQVALLEALGGGDMHGAEEYFDGYSVLDDDSYTEDQEMDDIDINTSSEDGESSTTGAVAYQVFDRMSRNAFPEDAGLHGRMEALIGLPPTPAPVNSRFPILHFSQTDIRLVAHPFAPHASVVCGAPLRQPFTHPIVSIRACDRFNMVKYVPEHGIVVAASQKGRAAIIALTESEAAGLSFRVDWIVPFESQEKYGDRPLIPLLGMSVSPIQGFEMPPDVPYIPRDVDENDLTFRYQHIFDDETDNASVAGRSSNHSFGDLNIPSDLSGISDESVHEHMHRNPPTLPECHARATRAYQPEERWRGWNPSRRYRLLLMYADHTVMSYEFWYNWNTAGPEADMSDEDEFLVV
ncbi:hypothetical protein P170DRAFT_475705 [Aspergillus steynii IBT 23096]|uniref:Uncharacterized protein n=1 Tax=Aspergillus steynii IBT 23096 TaxID=1392250 RepID=A0A2I2G975_9EURO|nr:uncharacterized protein P170DRAFT_475705 [Aspergillus steynii IBT 23096]PLB49408.1 hypothetical protein P170DRAFT_475705 [Aspergillus steynii IBT 23096]